MWLCGKCHKAMFTNCGIYETLRDEHGREQLTGLCLHCARKHGARSGWKTALGLLSIAAVTGYVCYSVLLHV
jgi:hypothetical protein